MEEFNPDKFLLDLQTSALPDVAKEKCEHLRQNLKYAAPELLGIKFFNGSSGNPGVCGILEEYASGGDELAEEMKKRFVKICESFEDWSAKRQYN